MFDDAWFYAIVRNRLAHGFPNMSRIPCITAPSPPRSASKIRVDVAPSSEIAFVP